jgi:hypothetical protein
MFHLRQLIGEQGQSLKKISGDVMKGVQPLMGQLTLQLPEKQITPHYYSTF